ncbi:alpha/beta hydrolase [Papillibacter cinnamivorans]|uniref:Serine aminopeptidase S33 domain-containing protein n=1 Tax=Papillibacter cinnamivorans DSM 12816 TaxID=1122930 RepID=A0A1W1ZHP0_9FIRM|nr:alpha/beta hydrolase [Papillibacter cinnamivorans]SMC47558.1 hypothetical protein SAMN02745168_1071 [Papillibacter cinnamivorans DSM 12816]
MIRKALSLVLCAAALVGLAACGGRTETGTPAGEFYEEISIRVGAGESKVEGLLTLPKDAEKPPVVILIQGWGNTDMDETLGAAENKPFLEIARGLAAQGIATIRFNKRFYQYPTEVSELGDKATVYDEILNDASAAVTLAAADERLGPIFVLGHSLGGMLAPKVALDRPEVAGVISLAGTLRWLEDVILDQYRAALSEQENITLENKEALLSQVAEAGERVKALTADSPGQILLDIPSAYWLSLRETTGAETAKQLTCPVLALQGTEDYRVFPETDYPLWTETLGNQVTGHLYDGLNHLFMPWNGKRDTTEYDTPGHVSQAVIDDIAEWVGRVSQS